MPLQALKAKCECSVYKWNFFPFVNNSHAFNLHALPKQSNGIIRIAHYIKT